MTAEKVEVDKEKTTADKSGDTAEKVSSPSTKQPKEPPKAKKTEDKKTKDKSPLSIVGISTGTKQNIDSKPQERKSKNECDFSQQNDTDVAIK